MNMGAIAAVDIDAELMLRVRDGDTASFAELLAKHRSGVVHFLYRMVQDTAVSEELAQEVFLRVYKARHTYVASAKFTSWLFRIATTQALNWLRTRKRSNKEQLLDEELEDGNRRVYPDPSPTVEQQLLNEGRVAEIRHAIAALPDKQRAAVIMHKYDEMDYSQIAEALDTSESAVKSLLFRAYQTLRKKLAPLEEGVKQ